MPVEMPINIKKYNDLPDDRLKMIKESIQVQAQQAYESRETLIQFMGKSEILNKNFSDLNAKNEEFLRKIEQIISVDENAIPEEIKEKFIETETKFSNLYKIFLKDEIKQFESTNPTQEQIDNYNSDLFTELSNSIEGLETYIEPIYNEKVETSLVVQEDQEASLEEEIDFKAASLVEKMNLGEEASFVENSKDVKEATLEEKNPKQEKYERKIKIREYKFPALELPGELSGLLGKFILDPILDAGLSITHNFIDNIKDYAKDKFDERKKDLDKKKNIGKGIDVIIEHILTDDILAFGLKDDEKQEALNAINIEELKKKFEDIKNGTKPKDMSQAIYDALESLPNPPGNPFKNPEVLQEVVQGMMDKYGEDDKDELNEDGNDKMRALKGMAKEYGPKDSMEYMPQDNKEEAKNNPEYKDIYYKTFSTRDNMNIFNDAFELKNNLGYIKEQEENRERRARINKLKEQKAEKNKKQKAAQAAAARSGRGNAA